MMLSIIFVLVFVTVYLIYNQLYVVKEKASSELLKGLVPEEKTPLSPTGALKEGRLIPKAVMQHTRGLDKLNFVKKMHERLIRAGISMSAVELFILKIVLAFIGLIVANIFFPGKIFGILILGVIGFVLPDVWLKNKIKARQRMINKDLPLVVNILGLCVNAGADFMLSLQRIVTDFRRGPLTEELEEVLRLVRIGKSKEEALRNFAWRTDMREVYSLVRVLIQAEKMGTPISSVLNSLAEEVRIERFHRGEAQALKAPLKLLIPLIGFILPVVLIIVGGPILLQFARGGIAGFR